MKLKRRIKLVVSGLLLAATLAFQTPSAHATICQIDSTRWTERNTCGADRARSWGTLEPLVPGGAVFKRIYAWIKTASVGAIAIGAGLNANGQVISGCVASDSVFDLYPVADTSGCALAVRHRLTAAY